MCDEKDIGFLVKKLSESINQRANQDFKRYQLTLSQVRITGFLKEREGTTATTQKDIEHLLMVSHPTVVGILNSMEKKGFIKTYISPEDRRMKLVELTGAEKVTMEKLHKDKMRMERQLVDGISEEELEITRCCLSKMRKNVEKESGVSD